MELLSASDASAVADVMQGLASPARIRILARLLAAPCAVGELAEDLSLGQPTVSNHLRLLRHLGLVTGRRTGRTVVYELHDEHVTALLQQVLAHVGHAPAGPGA
ncbi:ArsR/SmtB family transcription factor [Streptomyces antimicrobicus]|uniref:Metalloregulator ArsR/SmtB family transcription factor n=1 Tax=Streptomyces antimicrobicus TaxID=2883108 RepID=A0ABS8B8R8_9ACTN|nr:metalloregulator ArsR/SmtB family transcription factor [Streptomyces antimicrobicus]MCB5181008.1 metalloregulator ArsR/SmtB family transcription factor [Streptomyces antimicrobicus]